jgi:hypothetical protein
MNGLQRNQTILGNPGQGMRLTASGMVLASNCQYGRLQFEWNDLKGP